jgi:acetyl-CoA carboxylase biotin carboxyl carrier protein
MVLSLRFVSRLQARIAARSRPLPNAQLKSTDLLSASQTRKRAHDREDLDTFTLMATSVNAHITGTVWKIEVGVGDAVTAGQVCVIIESMKMEMPVEAPRAGRVETIRIAEGQSVAEGDLLLTLA